MRVVVKKSARRINTGNGRSITGEASLNIEGVDLSLFGAKEVRDVLKNKAHCLRAGFPPDHIIIATFDEIRDHYLMRVGVPTYLSQMLGELATVPIRDCRLYAEDGHRVRVSLNGNQDQPVQRFIAKQFGGGNLPFILEVHSDSKRGKVQIRYF